MLWPFEFFEFLAYVLFSLGFAIGTFEQLLWPARFKARELRVFRNHSIIGLHDTFLFCLAALSFVFLIVHFIFEPFHIYQLFLYVMCSFYGVMLVILVLSKRVSHYFYVQAAKASVHTYIAASYARLVYLILLLGSPFIGGII